MAQIDAARQLLTPVPGVTRAPADLASEPLARLDSTTSAAVVATGNADPLRIPQITIHAFCETPSLISAMERGLADRRMSRASAKLLPGGIATAIDLYHRETSPNLIIFENRAPVGELYAQLEALADVCVAGTKVIVIGHANDVGLYRELLFRGVSDYAVAPLDPHAVISLISRAYQESETSRFGRVLAFIGATGGAGSSTIAQNVAATIARSYGASVIYADLDLP